MYTNFGLWNDGIILNKAMQYAYMLFTCLQHLNQMTLFSTIRGVNTRLSDATRQHLRTPDCSY